MADLLIVRWQLQVLKNRNRRLNKKKDAIYIAQRTVWIIKNIFWYEGCTEHVTSFGGHYTVSRQVAVCALIHVQCRRPCNICRRAHAPPTDSTKNTVDIRRLIKSRQTRLFPKLYRLLESRNPARETSAIDGGDRREPLTTTAYQRDCTQVFSGSLHRTQKVCTGFSTHHHTGKPQPEKGSAFPLWKTKLN